MKIPQETIDKHSFKVMHKETGKLRNAIYAFNVPKFSIDDTCFIWIQAEDYTSPTSGWFWWNKKDFHNIWVVPQHTTTSEKTYITRYVVDIEWEGVNSFYGKDGSTDCGTVMALEKLLDMAIKDNLLAIEEDGLKAVHADWISYVTNVDHKVLGVIEGGKALHPKLRTSKGLWSDE